MEGEGLAYWAQRYVSYLSEQRRYSERTCRIYSDAIDRFIAFSGNETENLNLSVIRSFEMSLLDGGKLDSRTVTLYLSALSGFCKFLIKKDVIKNNPVHLVPHPKQSKRLPVFFREESMKRYFEATDYYVSDDVLSVLRVRPDAVLYGKILSRIIISILFSTGLRRSELVSLARSSYDPSRKVISVRGKGDKMRQVPVTDSLARELAVFIEASRLQFGDNSDLLLRTPRGGALYPVFVDRTVKSEIGAVEGVTVRKSPHVLRHTLATELLEDGAPLNSIKELLGHSSLAATQVYTHTTIERLQSVYASAHPRSKEKR